MYRTITTLLKSINTENGKLFADGDFRIKLADCSIVISLFEESSRIKDGVVRSSKLMITVCTDMRLTRDVDAAYLISVPRFDAEMDVPLHDGSYERILFRDIKPLDINLDGDWKFEVTDANVISNIVRKAGV